VQTQLTRALRREGVRAKPAVTHLFAVTLTLTLKIGKCSLNDLVFLDFERVRAAVVIMIKAAIQFDENGTEKCSKANQIVA
jgi:hypothetical protein